MRLELVPLIIGILVALAGLALVADSRLADSEVRVEERRRRARTERDRLGEALIGLGIAALGAALIGRDGWAWGNVAVLVGVACLAIGAFRNRQYLRELLFFRGAARRGRGADRPSERPPRPRIR